jgi:anti-anti-sigma regulatory factor
MACQTVATQYAPERKFAFHVERRPHFLVVAMKGDAGIDQADCITAELLRIPLEAYSLVVLNMAELTFLSYPAIGDLLEYSRSLWLRAVEIRLANVPAQAWLVLEAAGLGELFEPIDLDAPTRPGSKH